MVAIPIFLLDDTNPVAEETEYVEKEEDIAWLGFRGRTYASDYFEKLYSFAVLLIKKH